MTTQKNRTFLGVDSILYPKETKKAHAPSKKTRRVALLNDPANNKDPSSSYLEVNGLRGYGKSGARVSAILNEMNAKTLLQKAQSNMQKDPLAQSLQSKDKSRALANINEDILNKVESMISTKKLPEKVYNNNPPQKEVAQSINAN